MTVIAVDAMGGDFAPRAPVQAAVRAARDARCTVILVGDEALLTAELGRISPRPAGVRIRHASQQVAATDAPTVLLRHKADASVRVAFELLRDGTADAVISAGNTGAIMVAGKHVLGTLPGVERPAIATPIPHRHGACLLIDSGANVDCKPHYLVQFARMGQVYARALLGAPRPRVGLLSNGSEPGKGNDLVRQAFPLLSEHVPEFLGNVEPRELFRRRADVVVCDGFVGNLVLKTAEAAGSQLRMLVRRAVARSPLARVLGRMMRSLFAKLLRRTDAREIGGSLLVGLNGIAIVCHGGSNPYTLYNAIRVARDGVERGVLQSLQQEFAQEAAPPGGKHSASA